MEALPFNRQWMFSASPHERNSLTTARFAPTACSMLPQQCTGTATTGSAPPASTQTWAGVHVGVNAPQVGLHDAVDQRRGRGAECCPVEDRADDMRPKTPTLLVQVRPREWLVYPSQSVPILWVRHDVEMTGHLIG